jgi:SAM-dependent methyltransferase
VKHCACYFCGGEERRSLVEQKFEDRYLALIDPGLNREARAIVECTACGFVFHYPTLTDQELETLYARYRNAEFRSETPDQYFDRIVSLPTDESLNYQKTTVLNNYVDAYMPAKPVRRMYDVGTGGGVFVKTFLDHCRGEWQAYGVEPTALYAELAARRLNIPVVNGYYKRGLYPHKFDLITANKVLEHSRDPRQFLRDLREDVDEQGLIYVEVPNAKEVFTLPPDHDQLQYDHLFFFSDRTLSEMVAECGLKIVDIRQPKLAGGEIDLSVLMQRGDMS